MKHLLLVGVALLTVPTAYGDAIGVRNFRQIVSTLYNVTGASREDPELSALVSRLQTRLPLHGAIDEISSPMLLGLSELAGGFCADLITRDMAITDPARRRAHGPVNFRITPRRFRDEVIDEVARNYADLFWQRAPTTHELTQLKTTFRDTALGGVDGVHETPRTFRAMCVAAVSSLPFIIY